MYLPFFDTLRAFVCLLLSLALYMYAGVQTVAEYTIETGKTAAARQGTPLRSKCLTGPRRIASRHNTVPVREYTYMYK